MASMNNLTVATGAPPPALQSPLAAYSFANQRYVIIYLDTQSPPDVHELVRSSHDASCWSI